MLGKLIKYDLMADWKKYSALYAATLLVSVMLLTMSKIKERIHDNKILEIVEDMFGVLFMTLIVAIDVAVIVLTVMRFYKNVVRDEGYLTHTLPVHTWQILASKLISSYIWFLSAFIIGGICIGIGMGEPFWIFEMFEELLDEISKAFGSTANNIAFRFFMIIMIFVVLAPFFTMSHAYFCFALGNLSSSHKLGISVLAFFGINIAENIVVNILVSRLAVDFVGDAWIDEMIFPPMAMFDIMTQILLLTLIISFAISVGFFIASERIFAKKLNLE